MKKVIGAAGLAGLVAGIGFLALTMFGVTGSKAKPYTVRQASDVLVQTLDAQLAAQGGFVAQTRCVVLVDGKAVDAKTGTDFGCVVDARAMTAPKVPASCTLITFSLAPGAKEPSSVQGAQAAPKNCAS